MAISIDRLPIGSLYILSLFKIQIKYLMLIWYNKQSNETVSKWETGNGFPYVSIFLPLCAELDISVNKLLSGERLSKKIWKESEGQHVMEQLL